MHNIDVFNLNNIIYDKVPGISSEVNDFFSSDDRIKSYNLSVEKKYIITLELNVSNQPKQVLSRQIFFDFISFISYSNGGMYFKTEIGAFIKYDFITYRGDSMGVYFQIIFK